MLIREISNFADIDECSSRSLSGCGPGATCVNRVPGFTCECPPGFRGDGRVGCEPAEVRTGCQSDFDCTNNAQCGTDRTCRCRQGFEPKGALCVDINECSRQPDICGPFATCTNTQGGYDCRCQAPLTGNPPQEPCKGKNNDKYFSKESGNFKSRDIVKRENFLAFDVYNKLSVIAQRSFKWYLI